MRLIVYIWTNPQVLMVWQTIFTNISGFILFLDFKKAFDTVEHPFTIQTLKAFGFGNRFIKVIETFYKDINSCVSLPHGTSPRFDVQKGIQQGCPARPGLFILAAEILTIMIKNCEKLNIFGAELAISQFVDDTTLLLKNEHQIPLAIQNTEVFSGASGLFLNIPNCELLSIHRNAQNVIYDITVKTVVEYLGVYVTKDQNERDLLNWPTNYPSSLFLTQLHQLRPSCCEAAALTTAAPCRHQQTRWM